MLKENDIIMARIGSVGETAIFQEKEAAIFASYLIRINLNQEEILPKYYWCFTKTEDYWKQVKNLISGTVQPQFNANVLKEIQIPIPSLEEQLKIIKAREQEIQIINYQQKSIELLKDKKKEFLECIWENK